MNPRATIACLAALACSSATAVDPNACVQSFGFGNYGCADVTGTVLSTANTPVTNAMVSAGGATDPFEHHETAVDATGKFTMRLLRRWIPPAEGLDTVTTWFHTIVPASGLQPGAHDSAQVQVRFYRLQHLPVAVVVTLHTSIP